jgi:hypothetical protein
MSVLCDHAIQHMGCPFPVNHNALYHKSLRWRAFAHGRLEAREPDLSPDTRPMKRGTLKLVWQRYFLFVRLPRRRRLRYDVSLRS